MSMKHFIITMQYECDAEHEDAAREHVWDVFRNAPIGACAITIQSASERSEPSSQPVCEQVSGSTNDGQVNGGWQSTTESRLVALERKYNPDFYKKLHLYKTAVWAGQFVALEAFDPDSMWFTVRKADGTKMGVHVADLDNFVL